MASLVTCDVKHDDGVEQEKAGRPNHLKPGFAGREGTPAVCSLQEYIGWILAARQRMT